MGQLVMQGVSLRVGSRTLLENADLQIVAGEHLALVGPNGCGKSTLLRVLQGEQEPEGGTLQWARGIRLATVAQDPPSHGASALEEVLAADTERSELLAALTQQSDPLKIAEIHQRLGQIQAQAAPARAASLLAGLGFTEAMQQTPCCDLSGGWRGRVALAAALFQQADVLLLDEPTNHLDLEATVWLTAFLQRYPGTLLIVSHDRSLLNAVPQRIVHFDQTKLVAYRGGFDEFLRQRAERAERAESLVAKQQAQRAKLQSFIDRFRAKASKARQAQSRMKALEKLPPLSLMSQTASVEFHFPDPEPVGSPLIELQEGQAGYGHRVVLSHLNLSIQAEDRIALIGSNGNGKTTLLRVLSGRIALQQGVQRRRPKLRVGYFSQHQTEELPSDQTSLEVVRARMPSWSEEQARGFLGGFGFGLERAQTRVGRLSGGEKARLLLAILATERPHLLILDEPTNHLDMESVESLIEALNRFAGAVVVVSHDASLIERCADTLWWVHEGRCELYPADLEEYRTLCLSQGGGSKSTSAAPPQRAQMRRQAAEMRAALAPLKKRLQECEQAVEKLGRQKLALEQELADPALYSAHPARARALQQQREEILRELAEAETRWLAASEAFEQEQERLA